jgi:phage shock protein A
MRRCILISMLFIGSLFCGLPGCAPSVTLQPQGDVRVDQPLGGSVTIQRQTPTPGTGGPIGAITDDANQTLAGLRQQRDSLGASVANISAQKETIVKEYDAAVRRLEQARIDAAETRQSTEVLNEQIGQLTGIKAALDKEILSVTENRDKARVNLAETSSKIAECQKQLAMLKDQQASSGAVVTASQAELNRIAGEIKVSASRLNEVEGLIEVRQRQLNRLGQQSNAAELAGVGSPTTQPSTRPAANAALLSATNTPPGDVDGNAAGWKLLAATGAGLAVVVTAMLTAMYSMRKPRVFTCAIMDEASKASHRLQLTPGDRVDLGGAYPVKKSGAGAIAGPCLNVDRKGRLVLSAVNGFTVKLNNRPIGITEKPMVKPGNVVEVTSNGQTKRLLVGPVTAVTQGEKIPVKTVAASVRPA